MGYPCVEITSRETVRESGNGRLEMLHSPLGELPVLHVAGTPEEMGRQHGALLGDKVALLIERFKRFFMVPGGPDDLGLALLRNAWARLRPYVPDAYLAEMAAVVQGAREAGHDLCEDAIAVATATTNFDLYQIDRRLTELAPPEVKGLLETQEIKKMPRMSCTMLAAWGTRTVDGKMFSHRNLDWHAQTGIHDERLITVCRPEDGIPFVTVGYTGIIGALAGLSARGITVAEIGAFSAREELDGMPWTLTARRVLETTGSLEEAVALSENAKHTLGYNFMLSDGDPEHFGTDAFRPRAAALETNFECCEVFHENDAKERDAAWADADGETHAYGLPLREAIVRADTAFGKSTRALQTCDNGPAEGGQDGNPNVEGTSYVNCHKPMHDMLEAYRTGSEYVYPIRGTKVIEKAEPRRIGPEEMRAIAGTVAHNTEKLDEDDWNVMSVVYAPTDLELWVAYESCDEKGHWRNAPDTGYWHLSLAELGALD